MWHYEKVKYYPYDPKTDFVQKKYYESVIPITTDSGKLPQNIIGTSFLVSYGKISYVITARHVLKGVLVQNSDQITKIRQNHFWRSFSVGKQ